MFNTEPRRLRAAIVTLLLLCGGAAQAGEVWVKWSEAWPNLTVQARETRESLGDFKQATESGGDYYLVFTLNDAGEQNKEQKGLFCFVLVEPHKFAPGQDEVEPTDRSCRSYGSAQKKGKKLVFDLTDQILN